MSPVLTDAPKDLLYCGMAKEKLSEDEEDRNSVFRRTAGYNLRHPFVNISSITKLSTVCNDCHSFAGKADPTALERCLRGCEADYDKAGEAWSRPSSRYGSSSGSRRHSSAGERGENKSSSKKNSKSGSSRSYKRSIRA